MKRLHIFTATKRSIKNHPMNFLGVRDAFMETGELKVSNAGTAYEEGERIILVGENGTQSNLEAADLGEEDTYWVKVWPDRRWFRVVSDNTPPASHLHPA